MIRKIARVFREEGLSGIFSRARFKILRTLRPRVVRSAYGLRLRANWDDSTFLFYLKGSYGQHLSSFLKEHAGEFVFLDIGANQGLYSMLASGNPACRAVIAFEPIPETAALLRENLGLNRCASVTLREEAISDRTGVHEVQLDPRHTGSVSLHHGVDGRRDSRTLSIRTIDHDVLDAIEIPGECPILVKIDVEGLEEIVIRELMASRHFNRVTDIYYEVDEQWLDAARVQSLLEESGFTSMDRIGSGTHYDVHASGRPPTIA